MHFCPNCGNAIRPGASFCTQCGMALKKKSPPYKTIAAIIAAAAVIILAAAVLLGAFGKPFSEDSDAIYKASASVVTIYTYDANSTPIGSGSGFAAFEQGIIVTNYHVISNGVYWIDIQTADGQIFTADSILCMDPDLDIAILYAPDCTLNPLSSADSTDLEKGEKLTAIGSPKGLSGLVSTGVFSSYNQRPTYYEILFTASISHGSSGGALFNEDGKIIGITSGQIPDTNDIYYAIPFGYAKALYDTRTAEDTISVADFWELSDHAYSSDYVLANARKLVGKTITIYGYLSAIHHSGYLVSSNDLVLSFDTSQPDLDEDMEIEMIGMIEDQCNAGVSLRVDPPVGQVFPDDATGTLCVVTGKVMIYSENNSGTDIRFIGETMEYASQ